MTFYQAPPRLENQFTSDALLRDYLARKLPDSMRGAIEPELAHLGALSAGPLYDLQLADRENEPKLTRWDAWGRRVDTIALTPLWREAEKLAAQHGLVATAYERKHGTLSRLHQFALVYLLEPSLDVFSCPLAMTDGAARTLLAHNNAALMARALPRLTSRDPQTMWTSGQWMTERTGGSDVGLTETIARKEGDAFRLYGTKWFTSAISSQMALTLARPEGNGTGGRGLALFYVETRDDAGMPNGIFVNRLKDKLGTRKVPTAELTLDGARAIPVTELSNGVRHMAPMLTVTRTWNAVAAAAGMRRAVALAQDYAKRRMQFGAPLSEKPLHQDTLLGLEAEQSGAFLLAMRAAELLGFREADEATPHDLRLLRVVVPLAKLTTGKQAVAVASEALECFGGAGYVEDTGLPRLLRDAQVLPIWEGTTNVLSLDTLRALGEEGAVQSLADEIHRCTATAGSVLLPYARAVRAALDHAQAWLVDARRDPAQREAGARRLALTLGRTLELALLIEHAHWSPNLGSRAQLLVRRFLQNGVDLIADDLP